jgi:TPR repeat protein
MPVGYRFSVGREFVNRDRVGNVKQPIKTFLAGGVLVLALIGVAVAGPLEDGIAAYQKGNYAAAMSYWRPLADQGNARAQFNLGLLYGHGQGVPQDYAQAIAWYRKAADQGNADAQFNLGAAYDNGQGVAQDYAQAIAWYRKAADQGDAFAQENLGSMYANGRGVTQDYVQAHMWFSLSASRAPYVALRDLAVEGRNEVAVKMTPAQRAEAQRMAREWKPK